MAVLYNVYRLRALNEWAIRVRDGLVEIREGTRGARATYEAIPDDECAGGDPEQDMARRVRERVAAGYLHYGTGDFPNDRLRLVGRADPERLALYWSPCAPVSHDAFDTVAVYLAEMFGRFGARAEAARNDASGARTLIVATDAGRWGVRLNRHRRLHDWLDIAPPRVRRDHGALPVLALRYLQTRFPRALALSYDPQHRPDEAPRSRVCRRTITGSERTSPRTRTRCGSARPSAWRQLSCVARGRCRERCRWPCMAVRRLGCGSDRRHWRGQTVYGVLLQRP